MKRTTYRRLLLVAAAAALVLAACTKDDAPQIHIMEPFGADTVSGFRDVPHSCWFEVIWILIWVVTTVVAVSGFRLCYRYREKRRRMKREEDEASPGHGTPDGRQQKTKNMKTI